MRARHLVMISLLGVAASAAAGESWHVWTSSRAPVGQPNRAPDHTSAGILAAAPTETDEADLPPPAAGPRGRRALSDPQRRRDIGAARTHSVASPPLSPQPPRGSPVAPPAPAKMVNEPSRDASGTSPLSRAEPPPEPGPDGHAGQTAPSSTAAGSALPAEATQDAGSLVSHEGAAGSDRGTPAPAEPPRVTPPRLIDTAGTVYPGDAFHLTLRRQGLGSGLVVEGAEGTVSLRALISADGSVRSVDVTASSGSSVLDRAAADAVRAWRFYPATRDGVPIDAVAILRIRYIVR